MKILLLLSNLLLGSVLGDVCSWQKCATNNLDKSILNVHLVTHTHDDLGWLLTVDQYYDREVQSIYDTVIGELEKNLDRKFSFAETGYLMRWVEHNTTTISRLQKLVKNGQIEIIGGGWVQNDEAASHYVDIIDQMSLGLAHLKTLFGEQCGQPQAAWQIDPFGHSKEFVNLVNQMGHQSVYFGRLHYIDRSDRHAQQNNEFIWIGSSQQKTQLLTGALYWDYSPPSGFCFDKYCDDEELNDDPNSPGYNIPRRAEQFYETVRDQANHYKTNNVILTMGMDFHYQNATKNFQNLDKLIKYMNSQQSKYSMNVQYSTPACYTNALKATQTIFKPKNDDFFPYASAEHSFWTGYFTSRPAFKGMIRQASSYLNLAKQLSGELLLNDDAQIEIAKRASALVQHHDAVTGTAKQVVTYDYQQRLANGIKQLEILASDAIKTASLSNSPAPAYKLCLEANETTCPAISSANSYVVTLFNPTGQTVQTVALLPSYAQTVSVLDFNGQNAPANLSVAPSFQSNNASGAKYTLQIPVSLEPLGFRSFFVKNSPTNDNNDAIHAVESTPIQKDDVVTIENELLRLLFDQDGFLYAVFDKTTNTQQALRQEFFYYESEGFASQPSGAYIFRPQKTQPELISSTISIQTLNSPYVQEVRQQVSDWVSQVIRLYTNQSFIEFDWVIGPIPKESLAPIGKEVITRYTSNVASNGVFYTDSSGRQMLKRTVNAYPTFQYDNTEPIAGNYYPVTNRIYIKDSSTQLTVLTDRSQGGTSFNGAIELMLHRRCFFDDHFGVDEALNEPGKDGRGLIVRGQHRLFFGSPKTAAAVHKPQAVQLFHRPVPLFYASQDFTSYRATYQTRYAGLNRELPSNVNLLTLEKVSASTVLLRLEHIFEANEDPILSQNVTVDLTKLFSRITVIAAQELTLGANRNAAGQSTMITLNPQEIGTYLLTVRARVQTN